VGAAAIFPRRVSGLAVAELDATSSSADVHLELCDVGLVMARQSGRNRVVAA
jgi:hypothetical protein